ncbi:hypothetical protein FACS1894216_19510 [Synergistales bacterium]|nr:hypothetical protein FACS1894216_19510 [Synergistales bacterium]
MNSNRNNTQTNGLGDAFYMTGLVAFDTAVIITTVVATAYGLGGIALPLAIKTIGSSMAIYALFKAANDYLNHKSGDEKFLRELMVNGVVLSGANIPSQVVDLLLRAAKDGFAKATDDMGKEYYRNLIELLEARKNGDSESSSDPDNPNNNDASTGADFGDFSDNWHRIYKESCNATPPPRVDPLIIDLNRDGAIDLTRESYFDVDVNGFAEKTKWIDGTDGFLALDRNADGVINDGSELFGDKTLKNDGTIATSGFDALQELDSNNDGIIDANDAAYADLRVWADVNANGISEADELLTLEDLGIVSIDVTNTTAGTPVDGAQSGQKSAVIWADGENSFIQELFPETDTLLTREIDVLETPEYYASLPNLHSAGSLRSLQQAMVRDETGQLEEALLAYLVADFGTQTSALDNLLTLWAGTADVDTASRGGNIDARKLAFIENFIRSSFSGVGGSNPNTEAAAILNRLYDSIRGTLEAQILMQTYLKGFFANVEEFVDSDTGEKVINFDKAFSVLAAFYSLDSQLGIEQLARLNKVIRAENILGGSEYEAAFAESLAKYPTFAPILNASLNLILQNESESIQGANTNDLIVGGINNNSIYAGSGNDVLMGGQGNDFLQGDGGSDVYIWNLGDGNDTINDYRGSKDYYSETDVLRIGEGVSKDNVELTRSANDAIFIIGESGERITLKDWYYKTTSLLR